MIFFYLTNVALDVSFGVLWWVTKNTTKGIYNGVTYLITDNNDSRSTEDDIDSDHDLDKEKVNFLDDITILDEKGEIELKDDEFYIRGEIVSLRKEIEKLKNYQKKLELV